MLNHLKKVRSKFKLLTLERILNANASKGAVRKPTNDASGKRVSGNFGNDRGGRGRGGRGGPRGGQTGRIRVGSGLGHRQSFRGSRGFGGPKRGQRQNNAFLN
ncbi:hypothetical protein TcWFU_004340 [Taenia crassiceps]|uniref:Uncharacterized protein n=1 Tax=Taenia crassiceps TaxID=6207 RepID=A0ABR4Q5L7_9CEST